MSATPRRGRSGSLAGTPRRGRSGSVSGAATPRRIHAPPRSSGDIPTLVTPAAVGGGGGARNFRSSSRSAQMSGRAEDFEHVSALLLPRRDAALPETPKAPGSRQALVKRFGPAVGLGRQDSSRTVSHLSLRERNESMSTFGTPRAQGTPRSRKRNKSGFESSRERDRERRLSISSMISSATSYRPDEELIDDDLVPEGLNFLLENYGHALLSKMRSLSLAREHLTRFPRIVGTLQRLQILDLQDNRLQRLPSAVILSSLPLLKELNISNNHLHQITDIQALGALKHLTNLDLSGNPLPFVHQRIHLLEALLIKSPPHMTTEAAKLPEDDDDRADAAIQTEREQLLAWLRKVEITDQPSFAQLLKTKLASITLPPEEIAAMVEQTHHHQQQQRSRGAESAPPDLEHPGNAPATPASAPPATPAATGTPPTPRSMAGGTPASPALASAPAATPAAASTPEKAPAEAAAEAAEAALRDDVGRRGAAGGASGSRGAEKELPTNTPAVTPRQGPFPMLQVLSKQVITAGQIASVVEEAQSDVFLLARRFERDVKAAQRHTLNMPVAQELAASRVKIDQGMDSNFVMWVPQLDKRSRSAVYKRVTAVELSQITKKRVRQKLVDKQAIADQRVATFLRYGELDMKPPADEDDDESRQHRERLEALVKQEARHSKMWRRNAVKGTALEGVGDSDDSDSDADEADAPRADGDEIDQQREADEQFLLSLSVSVLERSRKQQVHKSEPVKVPELVEEPNRAMLQKTFVKCSEGLEHSQGLRQQVDAILPSESDVAQIAREDWYKVQKHMLAMHHSVEEKERQRADEAKIEAIQHKKRVLRTSSPSKVRTDIDVPEPKPVLRAVEARRKQQEGDRDDAQPDAEDAAEAAAADTETSDAQVDEPSAEGVVVSPDLENERIMGVRVNFGDIIRHEYKRSSKANQPLLAPDVYKDIEVTNAWGKVVQRVPAAELDDVFTMMELHNNVDFAPIPSSNTGELSEKAIQQMADEDNRRRQEATRKRQNREQKKVIKEIKETRNRRGYLNPPLKKYLVLFANEEPAELEADFQVSDSPRAAAAAAEAASKDQGAQERALQARLDAEANADVGAEPGGKRAVRPSQRFRARLQQDSFDLANPNQISTSDIKLSRRELVLQCAKLRATADRDLRELNESTDRFIEGEIEYENKRHQPAYLLQSFLDRKYEIERVVQFGEGDDYQYSPLFADTDLDPSKEAPKVVVRDDALSELASIRRGREGALRKVMGDDVDMSMVMQRVRADRRRLGKSK